MRTHDYAKLSSIMTTDALQRLRKRMNELPQSTLDQKLSFTEADIQRVFLHSFVPSSDRLFGGQCLLSLIAWAHLSILVGQEYRPSYYATIVAFIRPPNGSLSTRLEDLLTCNITWAERERSDKSCHSTLFRFGRIVLPLGQWRITNLNFFDGVAVRHFRTNIV